MRFVYFRIDHGMNRLRPNASFHTPWLVGRRIQHTFRYVPSTRYRTWRVLFSVYPWVGLITQGTISEQYTAQPSDTHETPLLPVVDWDEMTRGAITWPLSLCVINLIGGNQRHGPPTVNFF